MAGLPSLGFSFIRFTNSMCAVPAGNPQQQLAALFQCPHTSVNNQVFQRVIQSQDPSLACQFNMHLLYLKYGDKFFLLVTIAEM